MSSVTSITMVVIDVHGKMLYLNRGKIIVTECSRRMKSCFECRVAVNVMSMLLRNLKKQLLLQILVS